MANHLQACACALPSRLDSIFPYVWLLFFRNMWMMELEGEDKIECIKNAITIYEVLKWMKRLVKIVYTMCMHYYYLRIWIAYISCTLRGCNWCGYDERTSIRHRSEQIPIFCFEVLIRLSIVAGGIVFGDIWVCSVLCCGGSWLNCELILDGLPIKAFHFVTSPQWRCTLHTPSSHVLIHLKHIRAQRTALRWLTRMSGWVVSTLMQ